MKPPRAYLGEVPLDANVPVSWSLLAGVDPYVTAFRIGREFAGNLSTGPVKLSMYRDGEQPFHVHNLQVIGESETSDPFTKVVLVADDRYWWRQTRIRGSFNIRRRMNEKRRLTEDGSPIEIAQVADDVKYAPWSLNGRKPWTPQEVVERILGELGYDRIYGVPLSTFPSPPLEDLEIDDEGGTALQKALHFLPGANVIMHPDGNVYVIDTTDVAGSNGLIKQFLGENPPFANGGHVGYTERAHLRPVAVRVLFQVEQEIRFDSIIDGETITSDDRYLRNVAPIPDPTLVVNGKTRVAGTYVHFPALFRAWNADKGNSTQPDISDELLREFWCTGHPEAYWCKQGDLQPTVLWVERIAACRAHFQQTYQIARRWNDRVYAWKPYRVSILDEENGVFGRAQAYAGHCYAVSYKGLNADPARQFIMMNVDGSVGRGQPLSEGKVSPAIVTIEDSELGIIRLDYHTDLLGHYRQIIPGKVDGVPTAIPSQTDPNHGLMMDATMYEGSVGLSLAANHRVAVVLTAIPAAPNGRGQFKAMDVYAADAIQHLSSRARNAAIGATGPIWHVRVGSQIATARYAWSDSLAGEIERAMGVGASPENVNEDVRDGLDELLLNPKELRDLAETFAAGVYASLLDGYVGDYVADMRPNVLPVGNIAQVTHTIHPVEGVTETRLACMTTDVAHDAMALLPESARKLFLRQVQT